MIIIVTKVARLKHIKVNSERESAFNLLFDKILFGGFNRGLISTKIGFLTCAPRTREGHLAERKAILLVKKKKGKGRI